MIEFYGLTTEEALEKQKIHGKNEIKRTEKINPFKLFLSQFLSPLILVLLVAAFISIFIGCLPGQEPDFIDASLIIIIVVFSGFSGFIQEYKAEKSIEALREMSIPSVQVIRDDKIIELPVTEITIDDIALVESGDVIPADGVILEAFNLKVDESILTGESDSVDKKLNDEVYMDTSVYIGNAKIKITQIGMKTKIGLIADKLQKIKSEKTSFEIEIGNFSKKIFWATGIITVIIFFGNYFKYDLYTSLLTAVSLAVAAIPEGLPAVVVLSLALGSKVMLKNKALVKKLSVVESIGAVDIICSDKTGTITKNDMTVVRFYMDSIVVNIEKDILSDDEKNKYFPMLECSMVCNNTKVEGHPEGNRKYIGEQTEIGLIKNGERFGLYIEKLNEQYAKIDEIPFSSDRKMMSVVVQDKSKKTQKIKVFTKGAPEVVLEKCSYILINNKIKKLTKEEKENILEQNRNFALNSYRVLGFAFKHSPKKSSYEENLVWIGLEAMIDPPHSEIELMIKDCYSAGIRVVMITGDNPVTAKAIADSIGLQSTGVLEGKDIDNLSHRQIKKHLEGGINIFARTNPVHKLKILEILGKDNRVAMTGDGVNDSLAIKQANVGISMGIKGTSVTKEASDIVLLDDNFSTIVKSIKEGRRIFENIRKFINYLLVSNIAEVFVLFLSAVFLTLDKPILLPVQILWINLLTDGLPALALGVDPARSDIMNDEPRKKNEPLIDKKLGWLIGVMGTKKTIVLLATFLIVLPFSEEAARTTLFTGFILYEFVRIASIRSQEKLSWLSNPWLLMALLGSVFLQIIIIYSPLNIFFYTVPLGLYEWVVLLIGVGIGYILAIIITKIINNIFSPKINSDLS